MLDIDAPRDTTPYADYLKIDPAGETERIASRLREILAKSLHRRGLVVAISGGVDSAVCCALAVRAVGPDRVFGLLLPERDSSPRSTARGRMLVEQFGIAHAQFDISAGLEALGCYRTRDEAMGRMLPGYGDGWKSKIVIAGGKDGAINFFKLVAQSPDGAMHQRRLDRKSYLEIVAATSFKQRLRKTIEYFHADRLHYAVVGTPNRLEYDQGFFVKNGDGSADVKPIAHLYKTQVYELAAYLELPEEIRTAAPSTDTYNLAQGQDEFYFVLRYDKMDVALYLYNRAADARELAAALGITQDRAAAIYKDIEAKRRTTAPLHWPPLLIEPVAGPMTKPPAGA